MYVISTSRCKHKHICPFEEHVWCLTDEITSETLPMEDNTFDGQYKVLQIS